MTKANDGSGNVAERDEWETPQKLWDELHKQYNFRFDCCANNPTKSKTKNYSYKFEREDYYMIKHAWMNPPFTKAELMFKHFFKKVYDGVAIYRCDNMETKIWQDIILPNASWIAIPKGRITYEGFEGTGSRFPSALIGFNVDVPKLEGFKILKVNKQS